MALLEKKIFIAKSGLEGAGKGLFAKQFIPKGSRIVEYKGRISNWKEVKGYDGNNAFIYYVNRKHVIDASTYPKALARYANDAKGLHRQSGLSNNARYLEVGMKVYIESTKDIEAGSEILVDYGKEYWQVIRHNLKVDRLREKAGRAEAAKPGSR